MAKRRAKRHSRDIRDFITAAQRETEWTRIVALCNAAFSRFHGFGRFVDALLDEMERQPPSSNLRLRGQIALMNIFIAAEQQRTNPSMHLMTNEDILEFYEQRLQEIVRTQPEAVLLAAAKAGWKVEEPDAIQSSSMCEPG